MKGERLLLCTCIAGVLLGMFLVTACAGPQVAKTAHPALDTNKPVCGECHDDMKNLNHNRGMWNEGHGNVVGDQKGTCGTCHNVQICGMCHDEN